MLCFHQNTTLDGLISVGCTTSLELESNFNPCQIPSVKKVLAFLLIVYQGNRCGEYSFMLLLMQGDYFMLCKVLVESLKED